MAVIDAQTLAGFALTSLIVELTPGPNMAYLALIAATEGRRPGFAAVAGVALGLGVLGLAAGFGLATLIAGAGGVSGDALGRGSLSAVAGLGRFAG